VSRLSGTGLLEKHVSCSRPRGEFVRERLLDFDAIELAGRGVSEFARRAVEYDTAVGHADQTIAITSREIERVQIAQPP
jgi:hypothetical protein